MTKDHSHLIGLIPAAGYATRLGPQPVSKEVMPVAAESAPYPRVAADFLLQQMRQASIPRAFMVVRNGKWDIPGHFEGGEAAGVALAYLVTAPTRGVPHTLDRAYAHVRQATVVLGFPDLLVTEPTALARLVQAFERQPADVLLGLLPLGDPRTMDAVEVSQRRVQRVWPKTGQASMRHTWAFAVWRPRFTEFLHDVVAREGEHPSSTERSIGDVIQTAIDAGLSVEGETIADETFVDLGTPAGLAEASRRLRAPR